ncbi:hypothetical protein [Fimbriimonas ginsengisoli]|uniref:Antitoxin SocA-like Panacea domain-containing protein n=1 Tax=Fimbriimonas ginsengisoli Gsoil 348 TaxID=661478 RepID=A0A068NSN0_FIMGI|nr:hypothetical protein [Fimbriimonas ginsengisoli]AIE84599.1 hypothetical protein OP10G_1231 [Fimbriimonas ginsengisoli Gsoil 348]
MIDFTRHWYILEAVKDLRAAGSWAGKTHVIKTLALVNLLEETPFDFVLYKHGPYSFDIDAELEQLRSYDGLVEERVGGYGPRLKPGAGARFVVTQASPPKNAAELIKKAANFAKDRDVSGLEAVVTSAWIVVREDICDATIVAQRLVELKPHISVLVARKAAEEAIEFIAC